MDNNRAIDAADPRLSWIDDVDLTSGDPARVTLKVRQIELRDGGSIAPDESGVTVLVGANNAGKSTMLRHLNAFLQSDLPGLEQPPKLFRYAESIRGMSEADIILWLAQHAAFVPGDPLQYSHFMRKGQGISRDAIRQMPYGGSQSLQWLYPQLVYFADARSRLTGGINSVASRSRVAEPPSHPLHRFQDDRTLFARVNDMAQRVFNVPLLLDDFSGSQITIRVGSVDLPLPARNEPLGAFGEEVDRLRPLDEQGDGMLSFFGLVIPLVADHYSTVLVDEPEAFLHPPQARALGKEIATIAKDRNIQLIVATHDKDFIVGLLTSQAPVTVVRIVREGSQTSVVQLASDRLREVWDDRFLRYSNVLDGLFAKLVVVAEADQDCRFYEAAFDAYAEAHRDDTNTLPTDDILFVPSGGKNGVSNLLGILRDLQVPTATILDIDAFENEEPLHGLVKCVAGDWDEIHRLIKIVTSAVKPGDWSSVKKAGAAHFSGEQRQAFDKVVRLLDDIGVHLVTVGELERFAPAYAKNREWLPNAIADGMQRSEDAQKLVARVLNHYSA